jgi:hypothetical protein
MSPARRVTARQGAQISKLHQEVGVNTNDVPYVTNPVFLSGQKDEGQKVCSEIKTVKDILDYQIILFYLSHAQNTFYLLSYLTVTIKDSTMKTYCNTESRYNTSNYFTRHVS